MACFLRHGCDEVALNLDTGEVRATFDDGSGSPRTQGAMRAFAADPTEAQYHVDINTVTPPSPWEGPFTDENGQPSREDVNGSYALNPETGVRYTAQDYITTTQPPTLAKHRGSAGGCVRDPDFTTYAIARWAEDIELLDTAERRTDTFSGALRMDAS